MIVPLARNRHRGFSAAALLLFLSLLQSTTLSTACYALLPLKKKRSARTNNDAAAASRHCVVLDASSSNNVLKSTRPPPPPWTFQASSIFYQFQAIPVDNGRRYCAPCSSTTTTAENKKEKKLTLLSFAGYTLGGVFCVEYASSPVGPYREVAILSSLVARPPLAIGAWASHIFVDSDEAAQYGQEFWGLPATVCPIEFVDEAEDNTTSDSTEYDDSLNSGAIEFTEKNEIQVKGWNKMRSTEQKGSNSSDDGDENIASMLLDKFSISLPSFSGLLPQQLMEEDSSESAAHGASSSKAKSSAPLSSSLLQYPLSIMRPSSIGVVPCKSISFGRKVSLTTLPPDMQQQQEVNDLLKGSFPLVAMALGPVRLVAGIPRRIVEE